MLYPIGYNSNGVVFSVYHRTRILDKCYFVKSDNIEEVTDVTIPDMVEIIEPNVFANMNINSVSFGNRVHIIKRYAFSHNNITDVCFPNNLSRIDEHAFSYNSLESLVIFDSVGYIGSYAFEYNKLKKIKLGKGLKEINHCTFLGNKIEELTFSDNIMDIDYGNFDSVQILNLVDIDLKYFRYFTKKLRHIFYNLKEINIKFKYKLSYLEQVEFDMLKNTKYFNILINADYEEKQDKKAVIDDEDINDLVNEIDAFLSCYSTSIDEIKLIVNELVTKYKNMISVSKPTLDLDEDKKINLSLDNKSNRTIRLELILKLNDILLILYEKKELFIYLDKLDGYLNNTIDDEIASKIKELQSFGSDTLVNKVNDIISGTIIDIENNILNAIKTGINIEYKNNLEIEINNLYEKYQELLDTIKPYMDLLNIIENNSNEVRISKDILDLELLISTLDKNSKEKFSILLEDIKSYFINILKENINKIKNNEEYISLIDIELLVRKRLDILLQELANTNYMTILFDDLDNYVNDGIEYLNDNKLSNSNSITSIIEDIYKVIENFSESEKGNIINKLRTILIGFSEMLKNKDKYIDLINTYKEDHHDMILPNNISILELILLNELVNILINVQEYKNELEEYNSLSNKSVNRL